MKVNEPAAFQSQVAWKTEIAHECDSSLSGLHHLHVCCFFFKFLHFNLVEFTPPKKRTEWVCRAEAAEATSCWIKHIKEFFTGDIVQLQCIKVNSKRACQYYQLFSKVVGVYCIFVFFKYPFCILFFKTLKPTYLCIARWVWFKYTIDCAAPHVLRLLMI